MIRIAKCYLKSESPYSQSRYHNTQKNKGELDQDYEERTWKNKMSTTEDGNVFIPPMSFANCLKTSAKYLSIQIVGKGKSTFTKNFESGVLVIKGLELPVTKEEIKPEWVLVPSDGMRGGTKRVLKCFPLVLEWEGEVEFLVMDDIITKDVFKQVLVNAGQLIGIGRFRPRNWGYYGRFKVEDIKWSEQ